MELPQDDLPAYLSTVVAWIWPRSDLHSWVKVLNKFDDILKSFIDNYDIDKLQLKPFLPLAKATILEILRFETLLLDNSTNRKLFASYDVCRVYISAIFILKGPFFPTAYQLLTFLE